MPKRQSIPHTKDRLFAITTELAARSTNTGVTSSEVAAHLMKELDTIPVDERIEVLRVGFTVLAGRVPVMNKTDPDQLDIFVENGLPLFVDLRIPDDHGKCQTQRYNVRKLRPSIIVKHQPVKSRKNTKSRRDKLIEWAHLRVEHGFGDVAVEDS